MRPEHPAPMPPWKKPIEPEDSYQPVSSGGMLNIMQDSEMDFFDSEKPEPRKPQRLRSEPSVSEAGSKATEKKSGIRRKIPIHIEPEIVVRGTVPTGVDVRDAQNPDVFLAHGTMPVAGDRSRPPFIASKIERSEEEDDQTMTQRIIREIAKAPKASSRRKGSGRWAA